MFAIFDQDYNCISIQDGNDENNLSLEIGVDIEFEAIIRENGNYLDIKKDELLPTDKIIKNLWREESYLITRNGKRLKVKKPEKDDIVEQVNYSRQSEDDIVGYRVYRGGAEKQIKVKNMKPTDCIIKQFTKDEIMTDENNKFIIKSKE